MAIIVQNATPAAASGITYGGLIEEILGNLQGFTAAADQFTLLAEDVDATSLSLKVEEPDLLDRGVIEVGSELMYVRSISDQDGTARLALRGYRGSKKEAHAAGTVVSMAPSWPRSRVATEINNIVRALYPMLYAVRTAPLFQATTATCQYEVPADCERVLDVRQKDAWGTWQRVGAWEQENAADGFDSGRMLTLPSVRPGQDIQVVYAAAPTAMEAEDDVFTAVTGLGESCKDVVVNGVMFSLLRHLDAARMPVVQVESDELNGPKPIGSAWAVAANYYKTFQQRMGEEARRLSDRYPARTHRTR